MQYHKDSSMKKIIFLICYLFSPILVFSQNSGGMIRRPKQKSSKTIVINKPKIIRVEVAKKIVRNSNISDAVFFVEAKDKNGIVYNHGNGFFISPTGLCITNYHILQGAETACIKKLDGEKLPITEIIDYDPQKDIVLFRTTKEPLKSVPLKITLQGCKQGDCLVNYAMPEEYRSNNSVTSGFCINTFSSPTSGNLFQFSAPVNEFSSGSPILNTKGEVVGIATSRMECDYQGTIAVGIQEISKLKGNKKLSVNKLSDNEYENENVRQAISLGNAGQLYKAIMMLSNEINIHPDNSLAYYFRGVYNCRGNFDYEMGLEDLRRANTIEGYSRYDHIMHYATFLKNKLIDKVENENNYDNYLYGMICSVLNKAITLDGERGDAYSNLAHVITIFYKNRDDSKLKDALFVANKSVELQPIAENYVNRAEIEMKLKDFSSAQTDLEVAMELNPDFYRSYFTYGNMLFYDLHRYNEGLSYMQQALDKVPKQRNKDIADILALIGMSKASVVFLGLSTEPTKMLHESIDDIDRAYSLNPRNLYLERKSEILEEINKRKSN